MRFSTKTLFALVAAIALFLVPIVWLRNHSMTWGPAEHTADVLHNLASQIINRELTEKEIVELLKSPEYEYHGIHAYHIDIEKRPDELIWFAPNSKYSVGLSTDGVVIWMVNGKRPRD